MFFLAHGALGPYDELVYLGVAAIFVTMMGVSWFRTRMGEYDDDQHADNLQSPIETTPQERHADRFTLE